MRSTLTLLTLAVLVAAGPGAPAAAASGDPDPFAGALFSPEEVIQHQAAIGLTSEQRRALISEITAAQADFLPAQMELAEQAEQLKRLVALPRIDEAAAIAVAGRLLELEVQIKRRHLELAFRIKNLLEADQQARLTELRGGD